MVTGILEGVGAGIGIAGLLAGFKGAIDGYLLIESIFDKENGLRDLILDYNIECQKLENWGDRFNVKALDERDCLFYHERGPIKALMAEIFGRIEYFHAQATKFIDVHEVSDHRVDYEKLPGSAGSFNKHLQLHSVEAQAMSNAQMGKKQRKRAKLAIKNKGKFEEVVRRLRKANDDLLGLLSEPSLDSFMRALPAYVLANTTTTADLQQTRSVPGRVNDLIRQAARLKLLQSTTADSREAVLIDSQSLQPVQTSTQAPISRPLCIYNDVARTWIEWLEIERSLTPVETNHSKERIKILSVMLQTSSDSFQIARCIGYTDDLCRTGLVFQVPQNISMATPVSLLEIINAHKTTPSPPLGDKFRLAQSLATTLMQLHTSSWLHKAFRSDNILFYSSPSGTSPITSPYLAGFEYSRDTKMQSIGTRPNGQNSLDYYYHPDVGGGFTKKLDLYSLGVVLLEIAYWRPLASKIPTEDRRSLTSIRDLFIKSAGSSLDTMMGIIYAGVVRACLNCSLPDPEREAEFACAMNTEIVLQLERCVA
ncbi:hypothetical protein N0V95_005649 [Ascochyta clinopodiicola]|nr:hypothetical protein N0V95_005649 [Ascochyta clinopodiicola]